jgi:hypothetical protein
MHVASRFRAARSQGDSVEITIDWDQEGQMTLPTNARLAGTAFLVLSRARPYRPNGSS